MDTQWGRDVKLDPAGQIERNALMSREGFLGGGGYCRLILSRVVETDAPFHALLAVVFVALSDTITNV